MYIYIYSLLQVDIHLMKNIHINKFPLSGYVNLIKHLKKYIKWINLNEVDI